MEFRGIPWKFHGIFHIESHDVSMENLTYGTLHGIPRKFHGILWKFHEVFHTESHGVFHRKFHM